MGWDGVRWGVVGMLWCGVGCCGMVRCVVASCLFLSFPSGVRSRSPAGHPPASASPSPPLSPPGSPIISPPPSPPVLDNGSDGPSECVSNAHSTGSGSSNLGAGSCSFTFSFFYVPTFASFHPLSFPFTLRCPEAFPGSQSSRVCLSGLRTQLRVW